MRALRKRIKTDKKMGGGVKYTIFYLLYSFNTLICKKMCYNISMLVFCGKTT